MLIFGKEVFYRHAPLAETPEADPNELGTVFEIFEVLTVHQLSAIGHHFRVAQSSMLFLVREHTTAQLVNPLAEVKHKLGLLLSAQAPRALSLDPVDSVGARVGESAVVQVAGYD